ncbi:putative DNA-binding WGR domain protein [Oxalobacteraceae bacterium GrIS 2.11]
MFKLYRFTDNSKEYWETWDNGDGSHSIHWGVLGTKGETKTVQSSLFSKAEKTIQKEINKLVGEGFQPIDIENHFRLLVEYAVDGMGKVEDLEKRHLLESRLNETLGWTGLGACDGGSNGSGSMEVCNFVVDFDLAKSIIVAELANTEFADYTRIYDEDA